MQRVGAAQRGRVPARKNRRLDAEVQLGVGEERRVVQGHDDRATPADAAASCSAASARRPGRPLRTSQRQPGLLPGQPEGAGARPSRAQVDPVGADAARVTRPGRAAGPRRGCRRRGPAAARRARRRNGRPRRGSPAGRSRRRGRARRGRQRGEATLGVVSTGSGLEARRLGAGAPTPSGGEDDQAVGDEAERRFPSPVR